MTRPQASVARRRDIGAVSSTRSASYPVTRRITAKACAEENRHNMYIGRLQSQVVATTKRRTSLGGSHRKLSQPG